MNISLKIMCPVRAKRYELSWFLKIGTGFPPKCWMGGIEPPPEQSGFVSSFSFFFTGWPCWADPGRQCGCRFSKICNFVAYLLSKPCSSS